MSQILSCGECEIETRSYLISTQGFPRRENNLRFISDTPLTLLISEQFHFNPHLGDNSSVLNCCVKRKLLDGEFGVLVHAGQCHMNEVDFVSTPHVDD